MERQVPVFISPRYKVARLDTQTLGSSFVASYDLQGYGAGIRTRLHAGPSSSSTDHSLQTTLNNTDAQDLIKKFSCLR
jgi:hypothetical protein